MLPDERAYLIRCAEAAAVQNAQAIASYSRCINTGRDLRGAELSPKEIKEAETMRDEERMRARAHLSLVQALQSIA